MIEERRNYYQQSYKAARGRFPQIFTRRGRFTREKALRGRFICDTVPPNRGATPEVPSEFSAGQALKERPPSSIFRPEPAFEEN
jgi:hypothetical protein